MRHNKSTTSFNKKPEIIAIIELLNIFILVGVTIAVILMHIFASPVLAVLRIPQDLHEIGPVIGIKWIASYHTYQAFLWLFLGTTILNLLGLHFFSSARWRSICKISSLLGSFLIWLVFLFFLSTLTFTSSLQPENVRTSLIYLFFSFGIFLVDLITFVVVEENVGI